MFDANCARTHSLFGQADQMESNISFRFVVMFLSLINKQYLPKKIHPYSGGEEC